MLSAHTCHMMWGALNSHGELPYRHAHVICCFNPDNVNVSVDSVNVCVRAHVWVLLLVQASNTVTP